MYYFPTNNQLRTLEEAWDNLPAAKAAMEVIQGDANGRQVLMPPLLRGYLPNVVKESGAKRFQTWAEFLKASENAYEERVKIREEAEARRTKWAQFHTSDRLITPRTGKTERTRDAVRRQEARRAQRAQLQSAMDAQPLLRRKEEAEVV